MASAGTEWRLAREKLQSDFRGSCLHDLELLTEAIEENSERLAPLPVPSHELEDGRVPYEPLFVPSRSVWSATTGAQKEVAARAAKLIARSKTTPLVIDVGPYNAACISVIQSLRRRYGLRLRADFEGAIEPPRALRLVREDSVDYLFAPRAPALPARDDDACAYRRIAPVHSREQVLLVKNGRARGKSHRLLVCKGEYPVEQLLVLAKVPVSAAPEEIGSLEKLIAAAQGLAPGDLLIAWQPLATTLEAQADFTPLGEGRSWVSLYCHERWHQGALRALADQFLELFASEWAYCRRNEPWAFECLGVDANALEPFTLGSLDMSPSSPRT